MQGLPASVALALLFAATACDSSDGLVEGAHDQCAFGGALNDCPDRERTPEGACWRLVDCGAIPLENEDDDNGFDWGRCVNSVEQLVEDRQRTLIACIAASTCDELRVSNHCGQFGDQ